MFVHPTAGIAGRIISRTNLILLVGVFTGCVAPPEPQPQPPPKAAHHTTARKKPVVSPKIVPLVEFGLFARPERGADFKSTRTFPLIPGVNYGWRLHVDDRRSVIPIREELVLPRAPKVWTSVNNLRITADGRTGITENDATVVDGMVEHATTVAEGDPPGRYTIRLFVDNKLVGQFQFDLVMPSPDKSLDLQRP